MNRADIIFVFILSWHSLAISSYIITKDGTSTDINEKTTEEPSKTNEIRTMIAVALICLALSRKDDLMECCCETYESRERQQQMRVEVHKTYDRLGITNYGYKVSIDYPRHPDLKVYNSEQQMNGQTISPKSSKGDNESIDKLNTDQEVSIPDIYNDHIYVSKIGNSSDRDDIFKTSSKVQAKIKDLTDYKIDAEIVNDNKRSICKVVVESPTQNQENEDIVPKIEDIPERSTKEHEKKIDSDFEIGADIFNRNESSKCKIDIDLTHPIHANKDIVSHDDKNSRSEKNYNDEDKRKNIQLERPVRKKKITKMENISVTSTKEQEKGKTNSNSEIDGTTENYNKSPKCNFEAEFNPQTDTESNSEKTHNDEDQTIKIPPKNEILQKEDSISKTRQFPSRLHKDSFDYSNLKKPTPAIPEDQGNEKHVTFFI